MLSAYANDITILEIKNQDIQEITADVTIGTPSGIFSCFLSNFEEKGPFYIGENCRVFLWLNTFTSHISKSEIHNIVRNHDNGNIIFLEGKIVDFLPDRVTYYYDYDTEELKEIGNPKVQYGVLDCGLNIFVELQKKDHFKVGDFIHAEGRLDIEKTKEMVRITGEYLNLAFDIGSYSRKCPIPGSEGYSSVLSFVGGIKRTERTKKGITWVKDPLHCVISGQIIEFIPMEKVGKKCYGTEQYHNKRYAVVDCGQVRVITEVWELSETDEITILNLGDFISGFGFLEVRRIR